MPIELKITFSVGIGIFRGMRTKGENAGGLGFLALGGFGRKGNFQALAHLDDAGRVGRSQGDGLGGDDAGFVNADALADPHHAQIVRSGRARDIGGDVLPVLLYLTFKRVLAHPHECVLLRQYTECRIMLLQRPIRLLGMTIHLRQGLAHARAVLVNGVVQVRQGQLQMRGLLINHIAFPPNR